MIAAFLHHVERNWPLALAVAMMLGYLHVGCLAVPVGSFALNGR